MSKELLPDPSLDTVEGVTEREGLEIPNSEQVLDLGRTLDFGLEVGGRCEWVWWREAEKTSGADISEFGVKTKAEKS